MINYAGDWDFASTGIKCFADQENASVFLVQPFKEESPVRVLAFSLREAHAIVAEYFNLPPIGENTDSTYRELTEETGHAI